MSNTLTHPELAALIQARAGVVIDPVDLERPGASFDEFGVDSSVCSAWSANWRTGTA
ncbi:hypothetical protein ACFQ0M_38960 [Kitasatospora aburaviensis]